MTTVESTAVGARTMTQTMADFAVGTGFADLPDAVVDYTKLLILDSLICGLAAGKMERTQMAHRLADRWGGPGEATVFGRPGLAPASVAASINSEAMNLLDADDTFFNSAHFVVMNVAAALAEAERTGASGAELVRAVAVGFDLSARVNMASEFMLFTEEGFEWSALAGSGYASIGAAASAGIVSGLTGEQMANALALVAGTAPGGRNANTAERTELASYKWAPNFHLGQCAMTAVAMAEAGYIGEQDLFDLSPGFVEGQGFLDSKLERITDRLGDQWWILESAVKYTPSCRYTSAPAAVLKEFMAEEGLTADDIESIEVRLNPAAFYMKFFREPETRITPDHRAPLKAQFNIPFVLAQVALGRPAGPAWYTAEAMADPRVWELAGRITTAPDPSLAEEWDSQINESEVGRPRRTRGALTIRARGRELAVESDYAPGDPWSEQTRPTWESVSAKFDEFCGELLSPEQRGAIVEAVRGLDTLTDVREQLSPLLAMD